MFCIKCGSPVSDSSNFCTSCGFPIAHDSDQQQVEEPAWPLQEAAEAPIAQPVQQPVEQPVEVPLQQPTEAPAVQPVEQPYEAPVAQPIEQPAAVPVEQSVEPTDQQPVEVPIAQTDEQPAEAPVAQPIAQPVEPPIEDPAVQPVEPPIEAPAVQPVEQPAEQPVEAPATQSVEQPVEAPVAQPVQPFQQQPPIQMQQGQPVQSPYAQPPQGAQQLYQQPYEDQSQNPQHMPPAQQQPPKKKGGVPVVPIIIGAAAVIIAIALAVVFLFKPGVGPAPGGSTASKGATVEKMIGDWKLASVEASGITMAGNINEMTGMGDTSLTVNSDGTGTFTMSGSDYAFKWKQDSDGGLSLEFNDNAGSKSLNSSAKLTNRDDALDLKASVDGTEGVFTFTKDGTAAGLRDISMDNATKIASTDTIIGTWQLSGIGKNGASAYGDASAIASLMPSSVKSLSVKFSKDGKVNFLGNDMTWEVGPKGNVVITSGDLKYTVKALDEDIVINLGQATDSTDDDVFAMFSKKKEEASSSSSSSASKKAETSSSSSASKKAA